MSRPNIALSATSVNPISTASAAAPYIPPHPQKGSPYHRYTIFLLPHPDLSKPLDIPSLTNEARLGFNLREFCAQHGINPSSGGAAHMWREIWDSTVSDIYKSTLSTFSMKLCCLITQFAIITEMPEPHYAILPKRDPYEEVKRIDKYSK